MTLHSLTSKYVSYKTIFICVAFRDYLPWMNTSVLTLPSTVMLSLFDPLSWFFFFYSVIRFMRGVPTILRKREYLRVCEVCETTVGVDHVSLHTPVARRPVGCCSLAASRARPGLTLSPATHFIARNLTALNRRLDAHSFSLPGWKWGDFIFLNSFIYILILIFFFFFREKR